MYRIKPAKWLASHGLGDRGYSRSMKRPIWLWLTNRCNILRWFSIGRRPGTWNADRDACYGATNRWGVLQSSTPGFGREAIRHLESSWSGIFCRQCRLSSLARGKLRAMELSTTTFWRWENRCNPRKIGSAPKSRQGPKFTLYQNPAIFQRQFQIQYHCWQDLKESSLAGRDAQRWLISVGRRQHVYSLENGVQRFRDTWTKIRKLWHLFSTLVADQMVSGRKWLQYNDGYSNNILSFVNNVRTKDGGTHETGLKTAITKAMNDYARRKTGLLKEKTEVWKDRLSWEFVGCSLYPARSSFAVWRTDQDKLSRLKPSAVDSIVSDKLTFFLMENGSWLISFVRLLKPRDASNNSVARDESLKWQEE